MAKNDRQQDPRFATTPGQSSGVVSGYQQVVSPIDKKYVRRNIEPYEKYGFPQNLQNLSGMSDTQLEAKAAAAVIKKFKDAKGGSPSGGGKPPTGGGGTTNRGGGGTTNRGSGTRTGTRTGTGTRSGTGNRSGGTQNRSGTTNRRRTVPRKPSVPEKRQSTNTSKPPAAPRRRPSTAPPPAAPRKQEVPSAPKAPTTPLPRKSGPIVGF